MNLYIKKVKIIQSGHPLHGKIADIYIENGRYHTIAESIPEAGIKKGTEVFDGKDISISAGWVDMRCRFAEPGNEQKETITSGLDAAAAGGFTAVVLMPSTQPPVDERSSVEYLISRGRGRLTSVYPAGCLTLKGEGKEMAGMYDMKLGGAVAFTDDKLYIKDSGVMLRLMQYSGNIGSPVLLYADDESLSGNAQANESFASTLLGFKGSPAVAEEIGLSRDLLLAEYTGVPVHVTGITTAGAVKRIREAKKKGIAVTAETAAHYLILNDGMLEGFDTNFKVKPPLRTTADSKELRKGVADGTIDVIVSDHTPEDVESKQVEWDFAAHGIASIETAFAAMRTALKDMPVESIIDKITTNPRKILGIPFPEFKAGNKAEFTLFDENAEWVYDSGKSRSLSRNTPFHGYSFKGKALAVFNNDQFERIG